MCVSVELFAFDIFPTTPTVKNTSAARAHDR